MRPPVTAAPAPGREAAHAPAAAGVPQSTSIGTPLARAAVIQQAPPRPVATPAPAPAQRTYLVTPPPAPTPIAEAVDLPDRAIRVGQIVCWQLALVAVGAATAGSRLVLILTALAAVSLVLLTVVRIRGLWLYRWAGILLTYVLRRRRIDLADEVALNLVGVLCGPTSASEVTVREHPYGLLSRPAGSSVALRVGSDAQHQLLPRLSALADSADDQPVGVAEIGRAHV